MLNSVTIAGNLGQDPDVRYSADGVPVTTLSIAVSEFRRNSDSGDLTKITHWFRAVAFGRTAEVAAEYLRKGSKVAIQGALVQRTWQDQYGNNRSTVEIRVNQLEFLTANADMINGEQPRQPARNTQTKEDHQLSPVPPREPVSLPDDDIPF